MEASLAGKVALVAGATREAGRGIAVQLGAAGATVYVTGRKTRSVDIHLREREGDPQERQLARLPDPRRPATVLHTSDCHLGASARCGEEAAFERAIARACEEAVDAVLIAGDLFDHVRVPAETLRWTAEQLGRLACPVVVIRGNHDVFDGRSVHERLMTFAGLEHVHVIDDHDGCLVEIPGTDVVVWGRAMLEHEPGYRPFAGLPEPPAGRWTIATGHGLFLEDDSSGRSSPIFASDLAAVTWDYVALGHVHAYVEVRDRPTPVRYPGATATSRNGTPGVVLVEFIPGTGARPRWVGLD